jgi:hypothetical protein
MHEKTPPVPWEVRECVFIMGRQARRAGGRGELERAYQKIEAAQAAAVVAQAPRIVHRWLRAERAALVLDLEVHSGDGPNATWAGTSWACDRARTAARHLEALALDEWPVNPPNDSEI